jgi:hypothetical protein
MTRRQDARLEMVNAEGVLRIFRDVVVHRIGDAEFFAIGSEAGIPGQVLTIYIAADGNRPVLVRVTDSYPRIVGGRVRHVLRLMPLDSKRPDRFFATRDHSSEEE